MGVSAVMPRKSSKDFEAAHIKKKFETTNTDFDRLKNRILLHNVYFAKLE